MTHGYATSDAPRFYHLKAAAGWSFRRRLEAIIRSAETAQGVGLLSQFRSKVPTIRVLIQDGGGRFQVVNPTTPFGPVRRAVPLGLPQGQRMKAFGPLPRA
jgi:hypothetical protein